MKVLLLFSLAHCTVFTRTSHRALCPFPTYKPLTISWMLGHVTPGPVAKDFITLGKSRCQSFTLALIPRSKTHEPRRTCAPAVGNVTGEEPELEEAASFQWAANRPALPWRCLAFQCPSPQTRDTAWGDSGQDFALLARTAEMCRDAQGPRQTALPKGLLASALTRQACSCPHAIAVAGPLAQKVLQQSWAWICQSFLEWPPC